jgi:hypothetical protein
LRQHQFYRLQLAILLLGLTLPLIALFVLSYYV